MFGLIHGTQSRKLEKKGDRNMSLDQAKIEIEALEGAWSVRADNAVPWQPFQNKKWIIDDKAAEPIEEIRRARELQYSESPQVDLSDGCRQTLELIWNGALPASDSRSTRSADSTPFHAYQFDIPKHSRWEAWRNHANFDPRYPDVWWCNSVRDAAAKYSWSDSGVGPFENLALALQEAVRRDDSMLAAAVCFVILTWGGVRSRGDKRPKAFETWIFKQAMSGELCRSLITATARLIPQDNGGTDIFDGRAFFMDSSSTKIYAALALDLSNGVEHPKQDVLIYDGRVAAALGLIARYTLASVGIATLPENLKFPVERRASRNPSCKGYRFPCFKYGEDGAATHQARARYARNAARYIQAFTRIHAPSADFFKAEQGLFMIGYAVDGCCQKAEDGNGQFPLLK